MAKSARVSRKDYMKLLPPVPEALRKIGEEAVRNGTDRLTSRQIDRIIRAARRERRQLSKPASGA